MAYQEFTPLNSKVQMSINERNNSSTFQQPPGEGGPPQGVPSDYSMSVREQLQREFGITLPSETYDQDIILPSRGAVYPESSPFAGRTSVKIRRMKTKDEDILINKNFWTNGTVFTELIRACLVEPVGADPRELLAGDRQAIINAIRITGYGAIVTVENNQCPKCNHAENVDVDLASFDVKALDVEPQGPPSDPNQFDVMLPTLGVYCRVRFPNGFDEETTLRQITASGNNAAANPGGSEFGKLVCSVNGKSGVLLKKLLTELPLQDRKAIRNFYTTHEPSLLMEQEHTCGSCGHVRRVPMTLEASLFRAVNG